MSEKENANGTKENFNAKSNSKSWLEKLFPYKEDRRNAVKAGAGIAAGVALGGAAYAAKKAGMVGEMPQEPTAEKEAVEAQAGIIAAKTQESAQEEMERTDALKAEREKKEYHTTLEENINQGE